MFGTVESGTLPGCKYVSPLKAKVSIFGFVEMFGLESKVLWVKTKGVLKFFILNCLLPTKCVLKFHTSDELHT